MHLGALEYACHIRPRRARDRSCVKISMSSCMGIWLFHSLVVWAFTLLWCLYENQIRYNWKRVLKLCTMDVYPLRYQRTWRGSTAFEHLLGCRRIISEFVSRCVDANATEEEMVSLTSTGIVGMRRYDHEKLYAIRIQISYSLRTPTGLRRC